MTLRERGLIWASALVALYGLEQARRQEASFYGMDTTNELDEVRRVINTHQSQEVCETTDKGVIGLMAHTYQTLRVPVDEWESIVKIIEKQRQPVCN